MIIHRKIEMPPEIKKQAYGRANGRCQFPNCLETRNLQIHHIDGNQLNNDLRNNLIVLCTRHRSGTRAYRAQQLTSWANNFIIPHRKSH